MKQNRQPLIKRVGWLSLFLSLAAHSLTNDVQQEVVIESQQQLIDMQTNKIIYIGDVELIQGTIKALADKITITRNQDNLIHEIVATGSPAIFSQRLDNGTHLSASGERLTYNVIDQALFLKGDASIEQGGNAVTGTSIQYDIQQQRIQAKGAPSGNDRVKAVFQPTNLPEETSE